MKLLLKYCRGVAVLDLRLLWCIFARRFVSLTSVCQEVAGAPPVNESAAPHPGLRARSFRAFLSPSTLQISHRVLYRDCFDILSFPTDVGVLWLPINRRVYLSCRHPGSRVTKTSNTSCIIADEITRELYTWTIHRKRMHVKY